MRSPIGPVLVLIGLATTVVLVLLLVQTMGLRSDLETARADLAALRADVESAPDAATADELRTELDAVEEELTALQRDTGTSTDDPSRPAGGGDDPLDDRLDEILDRIEALDRRVSEICENVPVC
jgi:hypothetical protein